MTSYIETLPKYVVVGALVCHLMIIALCTYAMWSLWNTTGLVWFILWNMYIGCVVPSVYHFIKLIQALMKG